MEVDMDNASSSSVSDTKYDVFLSFRGEETRDNFTSHLYAALCRKHINAYIDNNLERGGEISHGLLEAIEKSRLSVIIFSQNYAESSWCLDELVHILECKENSGQIVVPIFYHVDPSCVRRQKRTYEAAFARHESRHEDRLDRWRSALTKAAGISGWDSATIRPEAKLIEAVVQDIIKKLSHSKPSDDFEGLVGIQGRVKEIESLLDISSPKVRIVGIWGMGGIGKTTLAQVVYNRLSFEFEACCFLPSVREEWKNTHNKYYLRNKIFYELLGEKHHPSDMMFLRLTNFYRERLHQKKVLIILDDVDKIEQLEVLAGDRNWYGTGSRIIVTSRDVGVLRNGDAIYEVTGLDFDAALHLFNLNAFKENSSTMDCYIDLSNLVVDYAKGIPLALKVLGSNLCGKSKATWGLTLNKLKKDPDNEIRTVLKLSYDGLDGEEKIIFLDIACFFKGKTRDFAERILNGCGFSANQGIEDLIDKSLLTIIDSNKLWMHDLVEEMGRQIVLQESRKLEKRSRLWNAEDIYKVFKANKGTQRVRGIFLDMCRIQTVDLCPGAFSEMSDLSMLKLHSRFAKSTLQFPQGLLSLSNELRYLHWDGYPLKSLPPSFAGENLVELKMQYSKVEQLWEGVKSLKNLKAIDLSFSKQLIEIPNLSQAPDIESVNLRFCVRLREVPLYFQDLEKLTSLNVEDCQSLEIVSALPTNVIDVNLTRCVSLTSLPRDIFLMKSLRRLQLTGCSNFDYMSFPKIVEFLESLE